MNAKPTVALFTSTEGHVSLAESAREIIDETGDYTTVVFQEIDGLFPLYIFFYQFFPGVGGFFFNLSQAQGFQKRFKTFCQKRHDKKLRAFFAKHKPDLMISTYFMFNPTLEELSREHQVPLINVLPDPKTIHPLVVSADAAMNVAFDEAAVNTVKQLFTEKPLKVEAFGWLVRQRFNAEYDQVKIRQQLNLKPGTFTLLVSSGSDGTNSVLKILPALLKQVTPLQIIVACGKNQTLLAGVKALQKMWADTKTSHTLLPLTFTPEIHRYVQAADLVVGKAGPNSVFETAACHKPFVAITHISGQEDGNLDIIRDNHLGFVKEEAKAAAELLHSLIEHPEKLTELLPSIKKMAAYNQRAKTRLLQLAKSLITP